MADITYAPIALRCPQCLHEVARKVVSSYSFTTVACLSCAHQWTVEIARLPDEVRAQILKVEGGAEHRKRSA